jgi:hypothetical protein
MWRICEAREREESEDAEAEAGVETLADMMSHEE